MAGPVPGPLPPRERDPDILSASQVAEGLGFLGARAVTDLAAAGELPGTKVGGTWLFTWPAIRAWRTLRWPAIYERIAGPGVPDGPVLTAAELAGRLGFRDPQTVTDLAVAGELAGVKLGRDWLFSWAGIYQRIAGPGAPGGPVIGAAELAGRLGFRDPQTVTDLAAAGELAGVKLGRDWLFSWAAIYQRIAGPGAPDGPVIGAAELARRLGFRDPQTVTDLAAAGEVQGCKIGGTWLFAWAAIYQRIAGPGAPDGPVFSAAQLGRWLGASAPAVRRAAAPPGTARGLPGCKIGKQWLFALEAVRLQLAGPPEVPDTPGGGAADMAARAAGRTPLR